jgi:hypothetical protein
MSMTRAVVAALLAAVASIHAAVAQPAPATPYWLGETHGPHDTGTTQELWVDERRDEPTTKDPKDKRRLTIRTWYPADVPANAARAPYAPNVDLFQEWIRNGTAEVHAKPTRSVMNADIERGTTRGKAPPGVMEPKESHTIIQTLMLEFFEKYLKGSNMTPVLSRERSFADLRLETRLKTSPH